MRSGKDLLLFLCTVLIIVAFFLPWIDVAEDEVGLLTKMKSKIKELTVGGKVQPVAGYQIPKLASREDVKSALALIELFGGPKDIPRKAKLVYAVPLLAVLCFALSLFGGTNPFLNLLIVAITGTIATLGFYKIHRTPISTYLPTLEIGIGLWLTLIGFALFSLISIAKVAKAGRKRR